MVTPNYTEEEVWDLFSEYLNNKFQADPDTIQRGIYVDLYRDGSFFGVLDNPDEFAYLYCNRNLNFNISGNIVFSIDSDKNEEFSLETICEFLNKPFPKPLIEIGLTEEEHREKIQNLKTVKTVNKANYERQKVKAKIHNACLALIHAFEYERSLKIKNDINHIEQVISHIEDFNFIQERDISNIENLLIIHPLEPLLDDILIFFKTNKELIKTYFKIKYKDAEDTLKHSIYPNYSNYFSERMRRFGSLLVPLYNLEQQLVSAIHISNISLEKKANYSIMKEKNHTKGSHQLNIQQNPSECIFLTIDIDTADTLSKVTKNPVYAAINEDNLIDVLGELKIKYPDIFIIIVINNPFALYLENESKSIFRKSPLVKLMIEFGRDPIKLIRSGIIMPTLDLLEKSSLNSFSDMYLEFGLDEVVYQINNELLGLSNRLDKNTNESEYILKTYSHAKNILFGNHHLKLPELVTEDELKPQIEVIQSVAPEQPVIPNYGENSVLFLEKRSSVVDWLNEPIHAEIEKKEKRLQQQVSRFIVAAPTEDNADFN